MATFSFEPALFNRLNNKERGIIRDYKGSKKNDGTIPVTEQFVYRIVTASFVYKTTFLRKVAPESNKIQILKRRKKPLTIEERAELRKQQPTDWKKLVWEVEREAYRVDYIRETVELTEKLEINTVVKRGPYDWVVEDVKLVAVKGAEIESVEIVPEKLHKGHLYGDRLITKIEKLDSPVNRVISKLCALQNQGNACISGQVHETVKTCHASREPIPKPYLNDIVFGMDKFPHRKNKLEQIQPLMRGDYTEHVFFNEKGEYEGHYLTIAAESRNKGWKEHEGEFVVADLEVSEQYKPLSMPREYKESESQDKPDSPVMIDLTEAEKKLRAMGYL